MHLLATDAVTLDEIDTAVDLEQTPAEVVILSFSDTDLAALASSWKRDARVCPSLRLASLKKLRHPMSVDLYIDRVAAHARLIIVRSLGGLDYWRYGFDQLRELAARRGVMLVALSGDDRPDARLGELSTAPIKAVAQFDSLFREGGPENIRKVFGLAAALLRGEILDTTPTALGAAIVTGPDGAIWSIDDISRTPNTPQALVVYYRSSFLADDIQPVEALREALAMRGFDVAAVAVTSLKDPRAASDVAAFIKRIRPDVILNATSFSALRADETSVLDGADCPVLQVALSGATQQAWTQSARGLSPSDLAMNVVLPELDGRIFTRAVSFKADTPDDADLQFSCVVHKPEPSRIAYVADLAKAWALLRNTPRSERRIALMLSDYPARGGRAGYACGLDSEASVAEILALLADSGFDVPSALSTGGRLIEQLTRLTHVTSDIIIPLTDYLATFEKLPQSVRQSVTGMWGTPEHDPRFSNGNFRFPCVKAGKLTILLQPDRGAVGDTKSGYHDASVPPRHAYVALYAWLRCHEKINALIHLGTHGTLEWLPGKAMALSGECFPEAVLGPVPVIYPFIVNNPGEAVQAKRRISAVTIGHLTPPLSHAGLNGPLGELEGLIEEYADTAGIDKRRGPLLEAEILERAWRSGLAIDCGITRNDAPRDAIAKLDAQLCDIKDLAIRDHLHVFGRVPDRDAVEQLSSAVIRSGAFSTTTASQIQADISACAAAERSALIAALDGRRIAPGPSGAPTRGRRDVLPTGRNLTTIDPRAIPTRTAATIGTRAADEVVRRYLQDHGAYPKVLMLDIWASASLRTGGDDIAQALAYLGARPIWDAGSNRVTGIEVLPIAVLDRPRIDVTLRLSGLFRDIFQSQIALFDLAVRQIAARDEDDEWNPLAAARRKGASLLRAFAGAPGVYGAGAGDAVLDSAWSSRDDIGRAYLAASSHAYGRDETATYAPEAFAERVALTQALVHPQDDRERDLLDGDGVADFAGGFAAAAALSGSAPALYHLDTSKPEAPRARSLDEEIVRIVRGRLTNPRWIRGMLDHGHRGVAEMAQAVDALYAFAATTNAVPSHLFDAVHEALFSDEHVNGMISSANPDAAEAMAHRLRDAITRGFWTPRRNAVHRELNIKVLPGAVLNLHALEATG